MGGGLWDDSNYASLEFISKIKYFSLKKKKKIIACFHSQGSARSRDDLDMERALRPRINAPDVVRSTMNHKDLKYNENTIDNILGTPNKIVIPERYIPEQEPVLTAEEQMQRLRKAESIRKMLSETTALSTPDLSAGEVHFLGKCRILLDRFCKKKKVL